MFIVLGLVTLFLQTAGLILLRNPTDKDEARSDEELELQEQQQPIRTSSAIGTVPSPQLPPETTAGGDTSTTYNPTTAQSMSSDQQSYQHQQLLYNEPELKREKCPNNQIKIFRNPNLYILWFALAASHYGYIVKSTYYKASQEFGQSKISDDHFLAWTGTMSTVTVTLARPFWGLLTDKIGVKTTLIAHMTCTVVACSLWYFSLYGSPFLYMIVVAIIAFILSGAFIIFPLAVLLLFGQDHYSKTYGLVLSAQIMMNIISPPLTRALVMRVSWFCLFFSISLINALGTLLLFFLKE